MCSLWLKRHTQDVDKIIRSDAFRQVGDQGKFPYGSSMEMIRERAEGRAKAQIREGREQLPERGLRSVWLNCRVKNRGWELRLAWLYGVQ